MSIQKKLALAFGAMIIVPIILFFIAVTAMYFVLAGGSGMTGSGFELDRIAKRDSLFGELKLLTTADPDKLMDVSFLDEMDENLNKYDYGLVLRVDDSLFYSAERFGDLPVKGYLPAFGEFANQIHDSVEIEGILYKFRQHDYYLSNRQKGSIFIVEEAGGIEQFTNQYLPVILMLLLLILILTNGLLSYLVSKSLINPLKLLQQSTRKINEGDLQFQLASNRKDEIGELISDFEVMRGKLKESVEKQIQYENDRKLLLSNISHDLKTPISSIKGYVEGIQDGIAHTAEKRAKYLEIISKRANEMDAMIDELFLVSTLDLKQVPFHFEKINLVSYLKELTDEVGLELQKTGIELELLTESLPSIYVRADQEKLSRVMNNVIFNSAKYMDKPDGLIQVSLAAEDKQAVITIKDNGPGIPEASIPYLFEAFYRVESSRNKKTGGTGLGLTIAKQIIEGHSGSIQAESVIGQGTTIFLAIPREHLEGDGIEKDSYH